MKINKRKGPTPSLIGSANGKPKRVEVLKKSKCSRCCVELLAGQTCIEIPKARSAYSASRRFCDDCYQGILKKTVEDLEAAKAL